MRRIPPWIFLIAALALWAMSCGVVAHGRTQRVLIDSLPTGAQVEVDGVAHTTPVFLDLSRKEHHTVIARNPNGAIVWRPIESQADVVWVLVDLGTLPLVANVIDSALGGDRELRPDALVIPFPPADAPPTYRSIPTGLRP